MCIGAEGFRVRPVSQAQDKLVHLGKGEQERPVQMPDRWVRALGNAARIHQQMTPVFTLKGAQAQAFVAALPPATGKNQTAWLTPARTGVKRMSRRSSGAVYVSGLHRLSALKRVITNLSSITVYQPSGRTLGAKSADWERGAGRGAGPGVGRGAGRGAGPGVGSEAQKPADGEPGAFMLEAKLPGARLTLSLTAESWQGYSGEGALLAALAQPDILEDAESLGSLLQFDSVIDELRMAQRWALDKSRVEAGLAVLAASGKLGFDAHEQAWFHRELPNDPERIVKDNPRLAAAQKLIGSVQSTGKDTWSVCSGGLEYRVIHDPRQEMTEAKCTCTWYLNHQNRRGPCKHILAVQLAAKEVTE